MGMFSVEAGSICCASGVLNSTTRAETCRVTRKFQNPGLSQPTAQQARDVERPLDLPQTHAGLRPLDSRMKAAGPSWGDKAARAIKSNLFLSNHMVPDTSGPSTGSNGDRMYRELQNKSSVPAMGTCPNP